MTNGTSEEDPARAEARTLAILEARAKTIADRSPSRQRRRAERRFLLFRLAGERLALDIDLVRAFLPRPDVMEIPDVPPEIRGVILHEGHALPVLALERLLGHPTSSNEAFFVVVLGESVPEAAIAIDAEEGIEVLDVPEAEASGELVTSTLSDGRSILDARAVLRDPRGFVARAADRGDAR